MLFQKQSHKPKPCHYILMCLYRFFPCFNQKQKIKGLFSTPTISTAHRNRTKELSSSGSAFQLNVLPALLSYKRPLEPPTVEWGVLHTVFLTNSDNPLFHAHADSGSSWTFLSSNSLLRTDYHCPMTIALTPTALFSATHLLSNLIPLQMWRICFRPLRRWLNRKAGLNRSRAPHSSHYSSAMLKE